MGRALSISGPEGEKFEMAANPDVDPHTVPVLAGCGDLAHLNPAAPDRLMHFEADNHVYTYNGVRVGTSVTCLKLVIVSSNPDAFDM